MLCAYLFLFLVLFLANAFIAVYSEFMMWLEWKSKFLFPPIIGESYEISSFVISPRLGRSPFPGYPFQWSSLWFISSFLSLKSNIIFKYQKFIFKGKQDSDKLCKTLDLNFLIMIMTVPRDLATRTLSFVFVFVFVCVFVIVNMCQWVENIITFP